MTAHRPDRPRRVLVVEDDVGVRIGLVDLLRDAGYHVDEAEDGRDALHRLHQPPPPDAIVLDLRMPVMNGWEFRVAQRQDPVLADIPVVALSADGAAHAAAIAADAFLRKPLSELALLEALRAVIRTHEQQRAEAARAEADRLATVGTLAAGIAHEINNPLSCVMGALRRLRDHSGSLPPGEAAALLAVAIDGSEQIGRIVSAVKSFAYPDTASRALLDLGGVLDSTIGLVDERLRPRATVVQDYPRGLLVVADEGQIGQVFLNLLMNASDAIPPGAPERHQVKIWARQTGIRQVRVEISDTGCGIAPAVRARIFEPFFTTKTGTGGTGLGLSIAHGLVRRLSGSITVESELGRGSTFRVVLPAAAATPHPDARAS
jgi:signal transduction histidine kinase